MTRRPARAVSDYIIVRARYRKRKELSSLISALPRLRKSIRRSNLVIRRSRTGRKKPQDRIKPNTTLVMTGS